MYSHVYNVLSTATYVKGEKNVVDYSQMSFMFTVRVTTASVDSSK